MDFKQQMKEIDGSDMEHKDIRQINDAPDYVAYLALLL